MSGADQAPNVKAVLDRIASEGPKSTESQRPSETGGRGAERGATIAAVVLVVLVMQVAFPAQSEFYSDQGPHMLITGAVAGGVALILSVIFAIARRM